MKLRSVSIQVVISWLLITFFIAGQLVGTLSVAGQRTWWACAMLLALSALLAFWHRSVMQAVVTLALLFVVLTATPYWSIYSASAELPLIFLIAILLVLKLYFSSSKPEAEASPGNTR